MIDKCYVLKKISKFVVFSLKNATWPRKCMIVFPTLITIF